MKVETKAKMIHTVDVLVIAAAKLLWKVMKVFDPKPIQTHYAARPAANSVVVTKCYSLKGEDAALNIARLCNYHIGSSSVRASKALISRKGLIKIYNTENGKFLMIRAQGNSTVEGQKGIPKDGIALNYDAKKALGIPKNQELELNLIVGPANLADSEFYHMYLDADASSRTSRALGWYLAIAGIVWALFQTTFAFLEVVLPLLLRAVGWFFI